MPDDAIVKGYELTSGHYVFVTDDELDAFEPERVEAIDIEEFVDLDEIDPIFYDTAYYLAPDKATAKPYALLMRAMEESDKVGIARFVMRIEAVRRRDPPEGRLPRAVDDGVRRRGRRPARRSPSSRSVDEVEVSDSELAMAQQLIESLAADVRARASTRTTYREQVLDLIERKAAGEEVDRGARPAASTPKGRRPHGRARGERARRRRRPALATQPVRATSRSDEAAPAPVKAVKAAKKTAKAPAKAAEKAPAARKRKSA